jgi:hypothetical protein
VRELGRRIARDAANAKPGAVREGLHAGDAQLQGATIEAEPVVPDVSGGG